MDSPFALENFVTLGLLVLLQAVLGFDNLLYIALESKRAPAESQARVRRLGKVIFWIVLMNLVFSFDSILSAMALSDVFWVMASAIVIGGVLMIWLADRVSAPRSTSSSPSWC